MNGALARSLASLRTFPGPRGWLATLAAAAGFAPPATAVGLAIGFLELQPVSPGRAAITALVVFFTPALVEEVAFRSWLPAWRDAQRPWLWIAGSTLAFVAYHFLWVFTLAGGGVFAEPAFLGLATLLGGLCAILRMKTGSLWPAVVFHWLAVSVWLTLFGGPYLNELLEIG